MSQKRSEWTNDGGSSIKCTIVLVLKMSICGKNAMIISLRMTIIICILLIIFGVEITGVHGQAPPASQAVPTIDAGLGSCTLELTIATPDGKPAAAANVKVHIAYGFGGFHKLDLEAGANSDGKVKFTGLPARVRRPPLEFQASKDQLTGVAMYDPASECQGKHDIVLEKPKPAEQ